MSIPQGRSEWYKQTEVGPVCSETTHCDMCEENGNCDFCDTIDGRWMTAVNEYASTCDGECGELTHHDLLRMDPVTQLGYCERCVPNLDEEIRARLEEK